MSRLDKVLTPNMLNSKRCTSNYLKTLDIIYIQAQFIDYCKSVRAGPYEEPCCKCIYYTDNINEYVRELCLD